MEGYELTILRFTNKEIGKNIEGVMERVIEYIDKFEAEERKPL